MIKEGFILRKMMGINLVMPTGVNLKEFRGALMLNDTGALIFSALQSGKTVEETAQIVVQEYEVTEEKAQEGVLNTIGSLKEADIWAD